MSGRFPGPSGSTALITETVQFSGFRLKTKYHLSNVENRCREKEGSTAYIESLSPEEQQDLASIWKQAYEKGDWDRVLNDVLLKDEFSIDALQIIQSIQETPFAITTEQSEEATLQSWAIKYVGDASSLLYDHLCRYPTDGLKYARYTSIVQSSGMGKSRAIDELSNTHLVVPLNLRLRPDGFSAADTTAREWLLQSQTKLEAFTRVGAFLCALFVTVLDYPENFEEKIDGVELGANQQLPASHAAKFRLLMTADQTFLQQGQLRRKFYDNVINIAGALWSLQAPSTPPPSKTLQKPMPPPPGFSFRAIWGPDGQDVNYNLREALGKLMKFLIKDFEVVKSYRPAITLSFDEAHSLTTIEVDEVDGTWSSLPFDHGQGGPSTPHPRNDPSARVHAGTLSLMPPFCELGFDHLAKKAIAGVTKLEDVATVAFMAQLGRPLFAARCTEGDEVIRATIVDFAAEKLLCKPFASNVMVVRGLDEVEKLACMSVRLPLEFTQRSLRAQDMESRLVEKHMRVCLSMAPESQIAVAIAPSEPLLAQASYQLMLNPKFDLPRSLAKELESPGIDKGSCGELVTMMLCLKARDAATMSSRSPIISVIDFIRKLLVVDAHDDVLGSKPTIARTGESDQTLEQTFQNSKIYFNHFIKVRNAKIMDRKFLWRLITRGAAVQCADYQQGIDVVIPFLYKDSVLKRVNVSAFFIQSQNDSRFKPKPDESLFTTMNPFRNSIAFFVDPESNPVPIIRMVFALTSKTPRVTTVEPPARTQSPRATKISGDQYTAFDIWCAGATHETFRPIKKDSESVFKTLLKCSRIFPTTYKSKQSKSLQNAIRSMNPDTDPRY